MTDRFTISLDAQLARDFDQLIRERGYSNRSEAVRDMLRQQIESLRRREDASGWCIANLSYVFNHHERELAERLTEIQHRHHDLCVSTTHAHLDHEHCIETLILRGPTAAVRAFADAMIAERGVRHGALNLVSAEVQGQPVHQAHDHPHGHDHAAVPAPANGKRTVRRRTPATTPAVAPHMHLKPRS